MTNESAELLRHAIIARACMDYDQALMYLAKPEEKRTEKRTFENECQKIDCERFFRSDWMAAISDLDGQFLMRMVREQGYCANAGVMIATAGTRNDRRRKKIQKKRRIWRMVKSEQKEQESD